METWELNNYRFYKLLDEYGIKKSKQNTSSTVNKIDIPIKRKIKETNDIIKGLNHITTVKDKGSQIKNIILSIGDMLSEDKDYIVKVQIKEVK